jgi:hypothetical protein
MRVLKVPKPPLIPDSNGEDDARIAVLFSGGLDCTVMARLAHEVIPDSQSIDLINVAFQNARKAASQENAATDTTAEVYEACPDRLTGRRAFAELKIACPTRRWRFIAVWTPKDLCRHSADVLVGKRPICGSHVTQIASCLAHVPP